MRNGEIGAEFRPGAKPGAGAGRLLTAPHPPASGRMACLTLLRPGVPGAGRGGGACLVRVAQALEQVLPGLGAGELAVNRK